MNVDDSKPTATRILVADDHPFFRQGVRALLDSVPGVMVVGEASEGSETIALAGQLQPDLILMDINMPGINGIEATRLVHDVSRHTRVIVLTMYDDDESVFSAMRAGAHGYLLKGVNQAELLRAITAVADGEAIFSPAIAQRLIRFFSLPRLNVPSQAFPDLTSREREILDLIARGKKNQEISDQLFISPKTVRNHITNIFGKLQVADRVEAIERARSGGLGDARY
jgi:DNA-binding NarL/FixJ family response regulator